MNRSIRISTSAPSTTATYDIGFDIATPGTLGSIQVQFCNNDPLIDEPCTAPSGLDLSTAVLAAQSGETGFTIDPLSTVNTLVLSRAPTVASAQSVTYQLTGVINPNDAETFYARITTYASIDATGSYTDHGGIALATVANLNVNSYVPPYLLFCAGIVIQNYDCSTASGNYINFGELSSQNSKTATTKMVLATNSTSGYNVYVGGGTMASGTDFIPSLATGDVSRPGTSQFGLNLTDNSTPDVGEVVSGPGAGSPAPEYAVNDRFRFNSGEAIIEAPGINDLRKYTVSYLVNIAKDQAPGIYITTLTYTAVSAF